MDLVSSSAYPWWILTIYHLARSLSICMALVWPSLLSALVLGIRAFSAFRSGAGGGGVHNLKLFPHVTVFILIWLSSAVSINSCMIDQASMAIGSADEIRQKAAKSIGNGFRPSRIELLMLKAAGGSAGKNEKETTGSQWCPRSNSRKF